MAPSFADIELTEPFTQCDRAQGRHAQSRWISRGLSTQRLRLPRSADEPMELIIRPAECRDGARGFRRSRTSHGFSNANSRRSPSSCAISPPRRKPAMRIRCMALPSTTSASAGMATSRLKPLTSSGQFEVINLNATTIWSYLREGLPFEFTKGMLDLNGEYFYAASDVGVSASNVHKIEATDFGCVRPGQPIRLRRSRRAGARRTAFRSTDSARQHRTRAPRRCARYAWPRRGREYQPHRVRGSASEPVATAEPAPPRRRAPPACDPTGS